MTDLYDSTQDTKEHIQKVQDALTVICAELVLRAKQHDQSKLEEPEKSIFDKFTPLLRETTYGSAQYAQYLKEMGPALQHHYAVNSHHPEHYRNGIFDMSLLDIVEMFCDWYAASKRHADGDFGRSLDINRDRFGISNQLNAIFENTRKELGW